MSNSAGQIGLVLALWVSWSSGSGHCVVQPWNSWRGYYMGCSRPMLHAAPALATPGWYHMQCLLQCRSALWWIQHVLWSGLVWGMCPKAAGPSLHCTQHPLQSCTVCGACSGCFRTNAESSMKQMHAGTGTTCSAWGHSVHLTCYLWVHSIHRQHWGPNDRALQPAFNPPTASLTSLSYVMRQ